MADKMTSMHRVLSTLSFNEPDRVPLFLLLTLHGAKELEISIEEYFSKAENVVEGQMRLLEKFQDDCLIPFFYASIEVEAYGGEVVFREDGPPNSGMPFIRNIERISSLVPPSVRNTPCLMKVLDTIKALNSRVGDTVPIIGVVMSPFSLPVMQMGFDKYIELMYEREDLFEKLMAVNEAFCADWANAQLEAGATAICYFDPVSSPTVIPREMYLKTGFKVAMRTLEKIKGPTATHLASGVCIPILDDLHETGTAIVGVSCIEDLAEVKKCAEAKVSILGNLNGIEMRRWTQREAENAVKTAIAKAGAGGGFILSDNHGEIPWQVPEDVLFAIRDAARKWGEYPLTWIDDNE